MPENPSKSLNISRRGSSRRVSLILASTSPRRQQMLSELGIRFAACSPEVSEDWRAGEDPRTVAVAIALRKARACLRNKTDVVVGMDTVVVLNRKVLGKPRDAAEAAFMLRSLSNRIHQVITGTAIIYDGKSVKGSETTNVHFRRLTDEEIDAYVRSKEPLDKAGAYGIQGFGRVFVEKIEGCFYNVVGFPISCFQRLLKRHGFTISDFL